MGIDRRGMDGALWESRWHLPRRGEILGDFRNKPTFGDTTDIPDTNFASPKLCRGFFRPCVRAGAYTVRRKPHRVFLAPPVTEKIANIGRAERGIRLKPGIRQ